MIHEEFRRLLRQRVLVLDGAMGAALWSERVSATVDELVLSRPEAVLAMHEAYIAAGADIVTTDTMNASPLTLRAYGESADFAGINSAGVALARVAAGRAERRVLVAGSMGCGVETVTDIQSLCDSLAMQAECLIRAGVDALLIETVFSLTNAEAAAKAVKSALNTMCRDVPVMMSVTIGVDGLTLSGHTPLHIYDAVSRHVDIAAFGLNCCSDLSVMVSGIKQLQEIQAAVMIYPNAGMPDDRGFYPICPEDMAAALRPLAAGSMLNIAGGCCGTTPAHIAAIASIVRDVRPRAIHI